MPSLSPKQGNRYKVNIPLLICIFWMLVSLLLIVPIWTALSAGLASLSLVIYGIGIVMLLITIKYVEVRHRLYLFVSGLLVVCCLVTPQLAFLQVAQKNGASLSFNPISYVTFSGATSLKPLKEVVYKTSEKAQLHIALYQPHTTGPFPTVVLLHGGGWRYGNHQEIGLWPGYFTKRGYAVASVQYSLSDETTNTWQQAPSDVHDAVTYLRNNASSLSVQPDNIILFGQSSGGHLALLEAYRSNNVRAVIALYAPIDLALDYQTSRDKSAELDFIGGTPAQFPDRYRSVSPTSYVSAASPRTLLIQGRRDDLVAPDNATHLSASLTRLDVVHDALFLPLTGHSFENQRGGFPTQITMQKITTFINE